jgi:hypothetical protein
VKTSTTHGRSLKSLKVLYLDSAQKGSVFLIDCFFLAVSLATVWALFLPPVKHSIYFNRLHVDRQDEIAGTKNHGAIIEDSSKKLNIADQSVFLVS